MAWHPNKLAFTNAVFGPATKATAFEPLDLNRAIGSKKSALVKLVIVCNSATSGVIISFRPSGSSSNFDDATPQLGPEGVYNIALVQGEAASVDVCTNDQGSIHWTSSDPAANLSIFLEGWLDVETDDPLAEGTPISASIPISAWPGGTIDFSSISNAHTLFLAEYQNGAGFLDSSLAIRAADDTEDLMGVDGASDYPGGCNRWHFKTTNDAVALLFPSNEDGEAQHRASSSVTAISAFIHCFINPDNGWNRVDATNGLIEQVPSTSWEDIDISSIIGARRAYVFLKITRPQTLDPGTLQRIAVRSPDSSAYEFLLSGNPTQQGASQIGTVDAQRSVYLAVTTDENGVFQRRADTNTYRITTMVMGYILNPEFQVESSILKTRNTLEVTFDQEPVHVDPEDPVSATNPDNWSFPVVVGTPENNRLIQNISYIGNNTIRIAFDGPLDPGIGYLINISNIESTDEGIFIAGSDFFISYGAEQGAEEPFQPEERSFDIANPQLPSQAGENQSLGTFQIDDTGDLLNDSGRNSLKKRIIRRITTIPGGFFHLPEYGLSFREGELITSTELRRLQTTTEEQIRQEPGVINVRVLVSQTSPGIINLTARVQDSTGMFEVSETLDLTEVS